MELGGISKIVQYLDLRVERVYKCFVLGDFGLQGMFRESLESDNWVFIEKGGSKNGLECRRKERRDEARCAG